MLFFIAIFFKAIFICYMCIAGYHKLCANLFIKPSVKRAVCLNKGMHFAYAET